MIDDVDADAVALRHEGNGATVHGLGCDVTDAEAVGAAGEPTIGDQRGVGATTDTLHGAGDGQHLPHPRAALGALVADHHDVASLDLLRHHGLHGGVLAVEDASSTLELQVVDAGHLHHRPFRCQRSLEHRDASHRVEGIRQRVDDFAVGRRRVELGQVLRHRPAGDGEAVAVQQPGLQQVAHHDRDATDRIDVDHVVLPMRLGVGNVGHARGHGVEVLQGQIHVSLGGDGQQMEHGVGGAAEGHGDGDGVLEGLLGHDLAGPDALLQQADHGQARSVREVVPAAVGGGRRRRPRQRHAERLSHRRHGVGGEHARAAALARAGAALDGIELRIVDGAGRVGSDRLEHRDDVGGLALVGARADRAAVDEHRRQVHPRRRHEHARQALVAPGQGHHPVEALRVHHCLDGVGDDLSAHQRRSHALVAHRDPVGHGDGHELDRKAAGLAHADLGALGQPVQRHVAGRDLVPRRRHRHLRLAPVVIGHPDGPQHGPGRCPAGPIGDLPAPRLDVDGGLALLVGHGGQAIDVPAAVPSQILCDRATS